MSLLVILLCLRGMTECTDTTAPLVIRKEMTIKQCIEEVAKIVEGSRNGIYANPRGGHYTLRCDPVRPRA